MSLHQQQQPSHLSRAPLPLTQIEPLPPLMGSTQPLSPTNIVSSGGSNAGEKRDMGGKQKELKGFPGFVGLSQIEYEASDKWMIEEKCIDPADIKTNYLHHLYEQEHIDSLKFHQTSFFSHYSKLEVTFYLPFDTVLQQIEFSLKNLPLFNKFLHVLKIEKSDEDQERVLLVKGGFIDQNKKVVEINATGLANYVKICFLVDKNALKSINTSKSGTDIRQDPKSDFMTTQKVSDKIKNEIIPLLHGSDDDIDELDDEVAMISNKKQSKETLYKKKKDEISAEDIRIQFVDDYNSKSKQHDKKHQDQNPKPQNKQQNQNDGPKAGGNNGENKNDDPENTRNFNSLPRNYTDNQANENDGVNAKEAGEEENVKGKKENEINSAIIEQEIAENYHKNNPNWYKSLIYHCIQSIRFTGFNTNSIPAITNMTLFLNESFYLKKEHYVSDALEYDLFTGILMISSKRYTQAAEVLRRIQNIYLKQIENLQKELNNNQNTSPQVALNAYKSNPKPDKSLHHKKALLQKLFLKSALIELLIVDAMSQTTSLNEKLLSIKRMVDLYMQKGVNQITFSQQIFFSEDPYSIMLKILPYLLKFVLMCLTHKKEVVRLSALRLLEFILETKGCSLDSAMVYILKVILRTYPAQLQPQDKFLPLTPPLPQQDSFSLLILQNPSDIFHSPQSNISDLLPQQTHKQPQKPNTQPQTDQQNKKYTEYSALKEPTSGFVNALKNAYNHCLETYISVLSSISSHILHQLFYEVIIPCLTVQQSKSDQSQKDFISTDIKIFGIKIAEKIITICQGDLLFTRSTLEHILSSISQKSSSENSSYLSHLKNLWQSIKTKVFTNYSIKGMKILIEFLVEKMSLLAQTGQLETNKSGQSDIAKLEMAEDEMNQLVQVLDVVSLMAVGRKKNEEEANNLIKIKQDYCIELYLLINPLLFWLDFSVEREDRLNLFKQIYQTIKDVLENLPPKRVDLDILQIMIPILQRTTEYLKSNSPSLSMLKFLDLVLRDIKQGNFTLRNPDLQYFFLEMLQSFTQYIPYSLYDEIFSIFDKLLSLCQDVLTEKALKICIEALIDKYTMKSKAHKNSMNLFMKCVLESKIGIRNNVGGGLNGKQSNNNLELDEFEYAEENNSVSLKNNQNEKEKMMRESNRFDYEKEDKYKGNASTKSPSISHYFDILCAVCFFHNEDPSLIQSPPSIQSQHPQKNQVDLHDMYVDKLQLFIDALSMLNENHINMFTAVILNGKFRKLLMGLLNKGETQLRLKCHEILEVVTNYYVQYCTSKTVYELALPSSQNPSSNPSDLLNMTQKRKIVQNEVMEVEFINHERLYISQIVIQCVKLSLDQKNDSYLQFNSLILLDFLFQNLLPVPTYQNEYLKGKGLNINNGSGRSNQNQSSEKQNNHKDRSGNAKEEQVLDLETMEITENTPEFEVTEQKYIYMRLSLIFKLWPYIQQALNSAWSNIRSICYGLICSMLKIDIRDFTGPNVMAQSSQLNVLSKLKALVLPMLMNLLSSKESESKAGGLNILGSFCGLSYDFSKVKISKNLDFFKKNSNFISLTIWQLVFDLQDDWDITIKEASVVLIQLCAPRKAVKYFDKVKKERELIKFSNIVNKYALSPGGQSSSSSRNQFYLNSGTSGDEDINIHQHGFSDPKQKNLLSFLSNQDDLTSFLNLDPYSNPLNPQSDLFEHYHPSQHPLSSSKLNSSRPNGAQRLLGNSSGSEDNLQFKDEIKKNIYAYDGENEVVGLDYADLDDANAGVLGAYEGFLFFVDEYNDEQIQEIISIFRNDFKPPKNLWIEKNPSAAYNSPDYYSEIFSSAIDQFNQQQLKLQQQQQEQLQQQVNNSPKAGSKPASSLQIVDALEDDLVKKYEGMQKEKEGYMIFERHFEEQEGETNEEKKIENDKEKKEEVKEIKGELVNTKQSDKENTAIGGGKIENIPKASSPLKVPNAEVKKTTDELIEEYERKINKTIQLLEEEKKKSIIGKQKSDDSNNKSPVVESNAKSTPEFKQKINEKIQENPNYLNVNHKENKKETNSKKQNSFIGEMQRGFVNNADNIKLMKQINNCFNEIPYSPGFNFNPSQTQQNFQFPQKQKQKLNKSFENLMAAQKSSKQSNPDIMKQKKNFSSSPRRNSSSGKKSAKQTAASNNKKKYIEQSKPNNKTIYNMRDLNFFIKTIEKDLSEKFSKMNLKDFNSMPTTPTSILKKVEDQVKQMAMKKEQKNYLSNTCPNIAQVLGSLDTSQTSKSNQVLQISNIQTTGNQSSTHTPSHISTSTYSQSNPIKSQPYNQLEKFSFSKTQKIDFKEVKQNIFGYQQSTNNENTQRDNSADNIQMKVSPKPEDKQMYANLLKSNKIKESSAKNSKRSRGSSDKYAIVNGGYGHTSGSNSQSKLNKSANNISSHNKNVVKKEQLSKSFIGNKLQIALNNNISPTSKKSVQQMLSQLQQTSKISTLQQTPIMNNLSTQHSNMMYDYLQNSEQIAKKMMGQTGFSSNKTPIKQIMKNQGGIMNNYSEMMEISPSSGEKEYKFMHS